jgi:hypothetical protein
MDDFPLQEGNYIGRLVPSKSDDLKKFVQSACGFLGVQDTYFLSHYPRAIICSVEHSPETVDDFMQEQVAENNLPDTQTVNQYAFFADPRVMAIVYEECKDGYYCGKYEIASAELCDVIVNFGIFDAMPCGVGAYVLRLPELGQRKANTSADVISIIPGARPVQPTDDGVYQSW